MTSPQATSRIRVRYADTDQMGVVYYANYFVWFEVGRTDLLRETGWSYREMEGEGVSLPVIEAHCVYRAPARYDDDLEVRTNGLLTSPIRLQFTYEVVRTGDGALLATGTTVHASLDRRGRPARLPDRVRRLFALAGPSPRQASTGRAPAVVGAGAPPGPEPRGVGRLCQGGANQPGSPAVSRRGE